MKTTGCPRETSVAVPREPNLSDVLNDPVVIAVMRADGVSRMSWPGFLGFPSAAATLIHVARAKERKHDERIFFTAD